MNYVETNLANISTTQSDCPRFTETRGWVKNFNQDQPVIITNSITENATYGLPGNISGPATKIEVSMTNDPYNHVSKTFVGNVGWKEGLTIATEDWADGTSGSERKRWTWTSWTQDDTNLPSIQNPRVIESKVGDTTNIKRTMTDYLTIPQTTVAEYGLVSAVYVYKEDQTTILKKVETDYNLNNAYVSRRIIGLPSEVRAYGRENSSLNLMSKVGYQYDEGNFSDTGLEQNISTVIQHDNNYTASFITGRGNLTSTLRYDVTGQTANVTSAVKYNITGAPVAHIDPLNRIVKISYSDKFNDGNNSRNTFAYPTKLTDPAGNYSEAKFRFDNGSNVWAKSPTPQGTNNTKGKETERLYDSFGRLERETLVNHGGAYTRYEYPSNGIQSKIYATLTTGAGEIMSERWTDGAGRVRYSRTEHPDSTGGWSGSLVEYDILGRVTRSTVPTEINPVNTGNPLTWIPIGDDNRGVDTNNNPVWLWTHKKYDWKGRVIREIKTDGDPNVAENDSDIFISYDGCGCAGGQETTVQGEKVPRDDQPNTMARRKQKVYADILGREYKSEIFDWNNNVYTTTVQSFNGRDQITKTTQYEGTENPNNSHQDTIISYDGHGRIKTRHNPIEEANTNTTWIYNADDTVQQIIDPRGSLTSFTYGDSRGLLTQISYDPPTNQPTYTTIPDTPTVQFQYDNAGNRTSMADGTGSTAYSYDELSRLKSETKTFTGLTGNFTISYDYQLSGKMKSVTDPFGAVVNYNDDKAGRTTSITGSGFLDVTTYAENIKYRAFGVVKEMDYGSADDSHISYQFDNRLRISSYQSTSSVISGGYVRRANYEYFNDGKIKKADNLVDSAFKQTFTYDYAGRLSANGFGTKLNSQNQEVQTYAQNLQYNVFGDLLGRGVSVWEQGVGFTGVNYVNGRKINSNEIYDALGNIVDITSANSYDYDRTQFDAAGQMQQYVQRIRTPFAPQTAPIQTTTTLTQAYDGDGKSVKRVEHKHSLNLVNSSESNTETTKYSVRSSVLDKVLTELDAQGAKQSTKIYSGETALAEQVVTTSTQNSEVFWKHEDIITGSHSSVKRDGQGGSVAETEPLGAVVPQNDPSPNSQELDLGLYNSGGDAMRPETGCAWNGTPISCDMISFITRGNKWQIRVNTRSEGGWAAYYSLRNQITIRRYDVYRDGDWRIDKSSGVVTDPSGAVNTRIASVYVFLVSPFWEAATSSFFDWGDLFIKLNSHFKTLKDGVSDLNNNPDQADKQKEANRKECEKKVLEPLKGIGFDLKNFLSYLEKGADFYNGPDSTKLDAKSIFTNNLEPGSQPITEGLSVSGLFSQREDGALTSFSLSKTKLTVFFDPDKQVSSVGLLFHEALHGYGAYLNNGESAGKFSDKELKKLFKIDKDASTREITVHINKYCGKFFGGE